MPSTKCLSGKPYTTRKNVIVKSEIQSSSVSHQPWLVSSGFAIFSISISRGLLDQGLDRDRNISLQPNAARSQELGCTRCYYHMRRHLGTAEDGRGF